MVKRLSRLRWVPAGLAVLCALTVAACSSTAGSSPNSVSGGGVVTFAESPSNAPNYIFPLEGGPYFSTANESQFSQNLYLPLYWFGNASGAPVVNEALSIARPPVFSAGNTVVTISLKHWLWSNGSPITARDVTFWMNLLSAATDPQAPTIGSSSSPGPGWGPEVPGGFPFNVVSYRTVSTYTVAFKLNRSYNPHWYWYNQLSQIYPMPHGVWDRLSLGGPVGTSDASADVRIALPNTSPVEYVPQNPGTATSGALGVAQFLNLQSQDTATYDSSSLWRVVDGPFRLAKFTSSGFVKLVPNEFYSGSPKPRIAAFEELPFTSDTTEFNGLKSGSVDIGYLPSQDFSQSSVLARAEGYKASPWYDFGTSFFGYNMTSPGIGAVVRQLYFRQAFQSLVDQPQYLKDFLGGLGVVTNGPVPNFPKNNVDESPLERGGLVYPYSPSHAVALLRAFGWHVEPGGVSYCVAAGTGAGKCGPGVLSGTRLTLKLVYAAGTVSLTNEMEALQSAAQQYAGIQVELSAEPFSGVSTTSGGNAWSLITWGTPWVYDPDFYPTGGELFQTGAGTNLSRYSSSEADALIEATHVAPSASTEQAALFAYEDYIARQIPMVEIPSGAYQLTMYKSSLHGVVPQGVYEEITPQFYYFG